MARTLTAAMQAALAAGTGVWCWLIELDFSGGSIYLTTASQDIQTAAGKPLAGQQTWSAVGGALVVEEIRESAEGSAGSARLKLSGVDQAVLSDILGELHRGREVRIFACNLNESDGSVTDKPFETFRGRMTGGFTVTEEAPGEGRPPTVSIEGRFFDLMGALEQSRGIISNPETHQIFYSGDTFFAHVQMLVYKYLPWGRTGSGAYRPRPRGYEPPHS